MTFIDAGALSAVLDHMPESVAVYDLEGRFLYVNAAMERTLGRSRDAILGQPIATLHQEATDQPLLAAFERVAQDGGPQVLDRYDPASRGWFAYRLARVGTQVHVTAVDVTEDRRRRKQLEERLSRLLAVAGKLAATSDPHTVARIVIDEGVEALHAENGGMWLLSPDRRELVLTRGRGITPEQLRTFSRVDVHADAPLAECVVTGRPVWFESRAAYAARYPALEEAHRPATTPPLAFGVLPIRAEGQIIGCLGFAFHDERRVTPDERTFLEALASHAAEALQRARLYAELKDVSETREAMIQASPAAIMLIDEQGVVRAWNPAAERIFGWKASEVVGRKQPAVPSERHDEFEGNLQRIMSGEAIASRETRRVRASGEWLDVEVYAAPVRLSDGRVMCLKMVLDISDRKRVERGRQLVAEAGAVFARSLDCDQTLQQVVELSSRGFADACWIDRIEGEGRLRRTAARAEGQGGADSVAYDPESLVGAAIESGSPQEVVDLDERALEKLATDDAHLQALRGAGLRSALCLPMKAGERVVGAFTFLSRARRFDALDLSIASELASDAAKAIDNARLYEEAQVARREAEAASQAKDQFLAMLGHELRNPLSPITTALHLMKLRAPNQLARERAVIERQVAHLTRLVDDLLDISRITRGKVELHREHAELTNVVSKAIEIASPLLEQRRHELVVDVAPALTVFADSVRLAQVLANLLTNAAKYTDPGGRIEVRAQARSEEIVLSVRDTGIGISPEILPYVFDMFVQSPQTSARTEGGLGLGLAIVRSLVHLHGGTVRLHSQGVGQGTEVVVTLPLGTHAQPTPVPPATVVRELPQRSQQRILVVDDNPDAATLLSEVLEDHGHQVRTAHDGPEAIRLAKEFRPTLAILDIGLPVMDGYELAHRLRLEPTLAGMRLIALTGYGQESDRERSHQAGFVHHLAKPVAADALVRLVDQLG